MAETLEPLRRAQVHLYEAFDAVITRSVAEYDLTPADVIGVLECIKYGFLQQSMSENDECEGRESWEGDDDGAA